jgi:hypothetical protein
VDRLKSDLVVRGTISRAGIAGLSIGNTAERMLGHLDCSMLTVKATDFVCPVMFGRTVMSVCAPVDFSPHYS